MALKSNLVSNFLRTTQLNRFIALLAFIGLSFTSNAKNYYFSSTAGDDSYSSTQAQSQSTPWKSLSKLNSFFSSLVAGDSILFKNGDTFYGSIIVTKSGTSAAPIIFSAYGTGSKPIITGLITLSTWSSLGNGIYQSAAPAVKSSVNLVTLNGKPQQIGRYPNVDATNAGYLTYESYSGTTSITDNQLTSTTNWAGAEVVIRKQHYLLERCKITSHSGSTLSYSALATINPANGAAYPEKGTNGFGYFIQRDARTLDQFGEWYFEPTGKSMQMYFGSNTPSSYTVKVSAVDTLINIGSYKYLTITNLAFEGGNLAAMYAKDASNLTVRNCDMNGMGAKGIFFFNAPNTLVENVNINYALATAIDITGRSAPNVTVRGCNIKNTGCYAGMGSFWDSPDYKGVYVAVSNTALIEYNNVDTTGYIGIHFQGNDVTVKNNYVNYYDYVKDDGGGIYTYTSTSESFTNRIVRDNIVLNGIGSAAGTTDGVDVDGIFLDGSTMNVNVLNNSIAYIGANGIYCNNPGNVTISGNTTFSNGSCIGITRYSSGLPITNLNITNNILYPKYSNQNNFTYENTGLNLPAVVTIQQAMQGVGTIENNYYNTPDATGFAYTYASTEGGSYSFPPGLTFEGWKSFTSHDLLSKLPPQKIQTYKLTSLVGSSTIANGQFSSDITNTTFYASNNNYSATFDNTSKITGTGSLKITPGTSSTEFTSIYKTIGAITAGKKYIVRLSTMGSGANGILNALIRKTASPYTNLAQTQSAAFATTMINHEFLFTATTTETSATLQLDIQQAAGVTYIDNIEFYEANATLLDINSQLRFEYNATTVAKTITLDGNYLGVDGAQVRGTLTLSPYTSKILIRDTGTLAVTPLAATATATKIKCYGGSSSVTVAATGGTTPYTGTGTFSVTTGSYTYTVRDAAGLSTTATVSVTQPTALQISATSGLITILGGVTNVVVTATGGTSPYTGTGTFSVTAGTYTYTVTDANGCATSKVLTIADAIISGPALQATATAPVIKCYSGSATVTVSATGGTSPYTGTGTYSVTAGTYSYTVRDAAGASVIAAVTVTQPSAALQVTATAGSIVIAGGTTSVVVTATGGTGSYTGTGTFSSISAGTYTYTVTDVNGCSASKTVTIAPGGSALQATATAPVIKCNGGSSTVTVVATGGTSPYTGTGTYSVSAGTYSYTVRDASGTSVTASVTVTQPSTAVQVTATAGIIAVVGGTTSVVVTATGGTGSYTGTGTFSSISAGTYTYTVTDANGCSASKTITIAPGAASGSTLQATASATNIVCFGGNSTVTVSATGGTLPYTGTGTFTANAGVGALKISFPTSVSTEYSYLYSSVGAISSAKNYVVKFSTLGTTSSGLLRVYLRQTNSPAARLSSTISSASFGTARVEHSFVFTAPTSDANGAFVIEVLQSSGTTYVDNVAVFEASATGVPIGTNLFSAGQFETDISTISTWSSNNNQTLAWDNSSKISNNYYYTVKDAAGASSVSVITTSQASAVLLATTTATSDITVVGGSTNVIVAATGGVSPYTGTGTFSVVAGTYNYTVTDARGCTSTNSITVAGPVANLQAIASASRLAIGCFGNSSSVTINGSGGKQPYSGTGTYTVNAGVGSLKISFPTSISNKYTFIYPSTGLGVVSSTKNYVLKFSTLGTTTTGYLRAYLRQTNTPYSILTSSIQFASYGLARVDHSFTFTAPTSETNASFVIEMLQNSGITYVDNIAFFEVTSTGVLVGSNLFNTGQFESNISNVTIWSENNNQTATWDNTSKISNTYYFTIKDNSSVSSTSVVTTTQPASSLQATASAGTITTAGGTTTVTVAASGGTLPYTGIGKKLLVSAGTYTYTVTDSSGCSATATITITQPVSTTPLAVTATATKINCFGASSTVTVAGTGGTSPYTGAGTYTATAGIGSLKLSFPSTNATNYTSLFVSTSSALSAAKSYVVRFTTLGTTSAGFLRVYLRQSTTPYSIVSTTLPSASFGTTRIDHQFIFTAPGAASNAEFVIEILQNSGTTYIDNLSLFEATSTGVIIGSNTVTNSLLETNITGIAVWSPNANQTAVWDNTSKINNNYYYKVSDAAGAASTAFVIAAQPLAALTASSTSGTITRRGGTTTVTVTASGGTAPYTGTGAFTVTAGTYTYTVKDANLCTKTTTITVTQPAARIAITTTATTSTERVSTTEQLSGNELSVTAFPNPSTTEFGLMVTGGTSEKIEVIVKTSDGRTVYQTRGVSNQKYNFGSNLIPGLYFIQVIQGKDSKVVKAIKTKS